jgi:hypothetical protein
LRLRLEVPSVDTKLPTANSQLQTANSRRSRGTAHSRRSRTDEYGGTVQKRDFSYF